MQEYLDENQKYWDRITPINESSPFYDLPGFLMGECSLKKPELEALGDVQGKSLLHLQCHFGMDTLSWARRGAKVTGVDFSGEAVQRARQLAEQIGIQADFVQSDILKLPQKLKGKFDLVFTSYGVLTWLPDIGAWARTVSHFLKKGGTFFIAEFHPLLMMYDFEPLEMKYSYFYEEEPIMVENSGSYADRESPVEGKEFFWNHSLAEITQALLDEGLRLQAFKEYPYTLVPWPDGVVNVVDDKYAWPGMPPMPMMFSLKMTK